MNAQNLRRMPPRVTDTVSICVRAELSKPRPVGPAEAFGGGGSPTPNALKIRTRWTTRQPRLTQIRCLAAGRHLRTFTNSAGSCRPSQTVSM
jgi:hypothetical protein